MIISLFLDQRFATFVEQNYFYKQTESIIVLITELAEWPSTLYDQRLFILVYV
jgi:hypothetical protein